VTEIEIPETADSALIRSVIQRVATGPELSKNISRQEAASVTRALLSGNMDPVQAAVILIGLRMKRETEEELRGVLDGIIDTTTSVTADIDTVISLSDPYNGFNRTVQSSLFVLPVASACGLSVYSHGVELCGPKYGVTHHTTLKALGASGLKSVNEAAQQLADKSVGWAYIDQATFCQPLYELNHLRRQIVKRPVLSTAEVMLTPIKGKQRTHLMTGYVHKPYRDTYVMLAQHCGLDSLLLVRGTEGGVIPSFRGRAHVVRYVNGESSIGESSHSINEEMDIDLAALALERDYRAEDLPDSIPLAKPTPETLGMKWDIDALSSHCAERGVAALKGEAGAVRDGAILGAALLLWHTGTVPTMQEAVTMTTAAVDNGSAFKHLQAGLAAQK